MRKPVCHFVHDGVGIPEFFKAEKKRMIQLAYMITDYSDSPSLGPVQREILSQEASLFQILDPGQTGERLD